MLLWALFYYGVNGMFRRNSKKQSSDKENKEDNKSVEKGNSNSNGNSSELDVCRQELAETKEKLVRVSADLLNFKKRVEKEKIQWMSIAQSELLHDILPVIDDFDRALQEQEKKELSDELKAFLDGFSMIYKSLYKFLEKNKVSVIAETKLFDPEIHEAISQIESPDHKSGEIISVAQKGFMLKDKVLRPAKVVVAK